MNRFVRLGHIILMIVLSLGGLGRASPFTPAEALVENVACLSYDRGSLSSNSATFTVGQVYGVGLERENIYATITPYQEILLNFDAENTGNGQDTITLSYQTVSSSGTWSFTEGTTSIPLGKEEKKRVSVKIRPDPKNKEEDFLNIRVSLSSSIRDGPIGGEDTLSRMLCVVIGKPLLMLSYYPKEGLLHPRRIGELWALFNREIESLDLEMRLFRVDEVKTEGIFALAEKEIEIPGKSYKKGEKLWFVPSQALAYSSRYRVCVFSNNSIMASWEFVTLGDLSKALVYPNPFLLHKHRAYNITFDLLTEDCTVKIYTIAGELVAELFDDDKDCMIKWRPNVSSGVYLYFISDIWGNKSLGKIGIVK